MSKKAGKEKHPLFNSWSHYKRKGYLTDRWKDFYLFVEDVGERQEDHRLVITWDDRGMSWKWVEVKQKLMDYESKTAYQREYMRRNPDKQKSADLKKHFGITLEEYRGKQKKQGNVCAICGNPEWTMDNRLQRPRELSVDHNHKTRQIRGLLCRGCNQGIGNFQEDLQRLKKAVHYLESFEVSKDVISNMENVPHETI
jgi:hypothetical protein